MKYYVVHRHSGAKADVQELKSPSEQWDDGEDAKLEALAEGARQLVRSKLQNTDKQQVELAKKQLIQQWLKA